MVKKGISPIIATLLLVALVVTLSTAAFVIFQRARPEAIVKFISGEEVSGEQACVEINLNAVYTGSELQVNNNGDVPVTRFTAEVTTTGGDFETSDYSDPILAGGSISVGVYDASQVEIVPWILGTNEDGNKVEYQCVNNRFTANIY